MCSDSRAERGGAETAVDGAVYGRIVGADFYPDDADEGEVVIRVAIPARHKVGPGRVVVIDADEFQRSLPTADHVRGILG